MAIDILLREAQGLPDDVLMEVVRFVRFIKSEIQLKPLIVSDTHQERTVLRTAGIYRGNITMAEDFDEPLDEFKEYV